VRATQHSRVPGAAQHGAKRSDALQTRDLPDSWRSRISGAPLRKRFALHRIRDTRWRGFVTRMERNGMRGQSQPR